MSACVICGDRNIEDDAVDIAGERFSVCGARCAYKLGEKHAPLLRRCAACGQIHLCQPPAAEERRPG